MIHAPYIAAPFSNICNDCKAYKSHRLVYVTLKPVIDLMAIKVFIPVTLFCSALLLFFSSLHVFLIVGRLLVPENT